MGSLGFDPLTMMAVALWENASRPKSSREVERWLEASTFEFKVLPV